MKLRFILSILCCFFFMGDVNEYIECKEHLSFCSREYKELTTQENSEWLIHLQKAYEQIQIKITPEKMKDLSKFYKKM